jgi:hypothetical protein
VKRRLFNLLTAVSLVLCAATAAIWVQSFWFQDGYGRHWGYTIFAVGSTRGCIHLNLNCRFPRVEELEQSGWRWGWDRWAIPTGYPIYERKYRWQFWQFGIDHRELNYAPPTPPDIIWRAMVPYWFLCLMFILFPLARVVKSMRRREPDQSLCSHCGYDLRATPNRCPECGTVPQADPRRRLVLGSPVIAPAMDGA